MNRLLVTMETEWPAKNREEGERGNPNTERERNTSLYTAKSWRSFSLREGFERGVEQRSAPPLEDNAGWELFAAMSRSIPHGSAW